MRVVVDTNVLVRAQARAAGPAREVVNLLAAGPHTLILSPFILAQVERVLNYPRLQARWPLTQEEIHAFVEQLQRVAALVNPTVAWSEQPIAQDPDDDPVIATAVLGQADVLCTLDRHLRSAAVEAYCAARSIRVLTDVQLLALLRQGTR